MRRLMIAAVAALALIAPARADFVSPGVISLGDFPVTSAGQQVTPPNLQQGLSGPPLLPGLTALSCQARLSYGGGGTKVNVYIQTSLDQGTSWFDIANIAFTTSGGVEVVNLSGLNSVATPQAPSNLGLADNTSLNGPLGDRLQAVIVSQGTYTGSTLASVRCALR